MFIIREILSFSEYPTYGAIRELDALENDVSKFYHASLTLTEKLIDAEARAAQLEAALTQAQAERDEARRKLEQAQRDLKEYREEIERMTKKAMVS